MQLGRTFFLNLSYVCNERCTFCAADIENDVRRAKEMGYDVWLRLETIKKWAGGDLPGATDRVFLAGGEPTLSRDLFDIVRFLGQQCRDIVLFTNALKLADPAYAAEAVAAGISEFQVAVYGATPATHDAVTLVNGSLERTLTGLGNLAALARDNPGITVCVRLLFSRQSTPENPDIVRLVHARAPGVTTIGLNRLILSQAARAAEAAISWDEARPSINLSMRMARQLGYKVDFWAMPLCLFDDDNAAFVRAAVVARHLAVRSGRQTAQGGELRYLDPLVVAGHAEAGAAARQAAHPAACLGCDYRGYCERVEPWYGELFGTDALRRVRLTPARPRPLVTEAGQ
jgi:uncharacterized Fe-S cluster-containing radical SAM superfamily protein